ncbi:NAD kinase [Bifidobacterium xylocopae]|uniref:NAD kinase n=1 Tax=Bifidobacterium xylocopae TaxID=2493119 RepID=A0A366KEI1_9BIFI|nr:NAD kinase [Bifidobacterium xylocopae]RBP99523.1 NAD kinase [Bifidobacterium xylocopae]
MGRRKAVVVTHQRVRSSPIVAEALGQLGKAGFSVSIVDNSEAPAFGEPYQVVEDDTEIVIVLGGDGTILRAAELVKASGVPVLGVNLGHVGFLAEFESFQIGEAMRRVADHDYSLDERMVEHVDLWLPGADEPLQDRALNDMTLERNDRGKMIEVSVRVDNVEMSSYGCDGEIVATPTGSTAYAFSVGGPVVWPDAQSLQMIPIAAHALFARPLIIGPRSEFSIDLLADSPSDGWICCDGRRQLLVPRGSRVRVRQSSDVLRLARLSGVSFTERLVSKFDLPVVGWREQGRASAVPARKERP